MRRRICLPLIAGLLALALFVVGCTAAPEAQPAPETEAPVQTRPSETAAEPATEHDNTLEIQERLAELGAPEQLTVEGRVFRFLRFDAPDTVRCGNMDGTSEEGWQWQQGPDEDTVCICADGTWLIYSAAP